MSRLPYRLRVAMVALSTLLAVPLTYAVYQLVNDNFHAVGNGALYRAGQMSAVELQVTLVEGHIRTVLNLRGAHPEERWYVAEASVAAGNGVRYVSIPISSGKEPDMATMTRIADVLRDSPKPILVHCQGGADRTGLASAIYQLAVAGESEDVADDQLSVLFGHIPWFGSRTIAMDRAFEAFAENWEAANGIDIAEEESERSFFR